MDPPSSGDPIDLGHADIHHDHVGLDLLRQSDGGKAVLRLANNLDVGLGLQQEPDPPAHQRMIIGQQYAHGLSSR